MKRRIRISESDLHNIVRRAVNEVINGQVGCFGSQYYNDVTGSHGEGDQMTSVRDGSQRTFNLHKPRNFNLEKDRNGSENGVKQPQQTESRDKRISRAIRESIKSVLKESETPMAWSQINSELGAYYPGEAQIVPFYSDETNICISVDNRAYQREGRTEIDDIMQEYGYRFYDAGGNGDSVMLTYKKA